MFTRICLILLCTAILRFLSGCDGDDSLQQMNCKLLITGVDNCYGPVSTTEDSCEVCYSHQIKLIDCIGSNQFNQTVTCSHNGASGQF